MTYRGCMTCKKNIAAQFNSKFGIEAILCEYIPYEFEWKKPIEECEDYEPNLHDYNAAPQS